ncbi:MAG TPA: hypothetical protein VMT24_16150, partial [Aggregatilineaceae bacterium]|nr:hypothetical protein [Aggregatilineaceae bacterium]
VVNSGFNENPGSVTVYLPSGAQDTSRTITNSNFYPGAITSDGVGNMWITAGNSEIDVYPVYGLNPPAPIKTFTVPSVVTGIAAHNMWIAYTGSANTTLQEIGPWLTGAFSVYTTQPTIAYCAAYDAAGNLYTGSSSSPYALNVTSASTNTTTQLAGLSNFPFGIAVDSARGRIYVSDPFDNLINVFDLKGNLIKVIQ